MLNRSTPIVETSLRGLHPRSIDDSADIRAILERARRSRSVFHRGLNTVLDLETAVIERIEDDDLILQAKNFERNSNSQIFLNFTYDGRPYFFETAKAHGFTGDQVAVRIPTTIFYSERRDRLRRVPDISVGDPQRVKIGIGKNWDGEGEVEDVSPGGLGVLVRGNPVKNEIKQVTLRFLDGREAGVEESAQLRNWIAAKEKPGWTRIGLVRGKPENVGEISIEYRQTISKRLAPERLATDRASDWAIVEPQIVRLSSSRG